MTDAGPTTTEETPEQAWAREAEEREVAVMEAEEQANIEQMKKDLKERFDRESESGMPWIHP